jgi:hypothetical protein
LAEEKNRKHNTISALYSLSGAFFGSEGATHRLRERKEQRNTLIVRTFFSPAFQMRSKEKDVKINKPGKQEK